MSSFVLTYVHLRLLKFLWNWKVCVSTNYKIPRNGMGRKYNEEKIVEIIDVDSFVKSYYTVDV